MIENRLIAVVLLIFLIAGAVLFIFFNSPLGPLFTLIGVIGYFIFNRKK